MAEGTTNPRYMPTAVKLVLLGLGSDLEGFAKKAEKEHKKQEEKRIKEAKAHERKIVEVKHPEGPDMFGDLVRIQSTYKTTREFVPFEELDASKSGQAVWIRGRLHNSRVKGKAGFLMLRRGFATVQVVMFEGGDKGNSRDMIRYAGKIPIESVIEVLGTVCVPDKPIASTTQQVEIKVEKLFVVSASVPVLPFQLEDAMRPEPKETEEKKDGKEEGPRGVSTDVRLDNRWMDLRTPANHAIFRLQSRICQFYRAFFIDRGFVEIHTPKITPGVSEGGAEVFHLDYFGQSACLAQSPQLYKQMGVISDLFKVFEIGHVFRAENSNTNRHMTEFVGLDFEMEIKEHYHEIIEVLGALFVYIFESINKHCQAELAAIQKQYPFEPLLFTKETLVLSFAEAKKLLRESGLKTEEMEDFSTPEERALGRIVREKYKTDFYIVDRYPLAVRPFYTMPAVDDPKYTNSYDVFLRGEEITSGAQRIHDVDLLKTRAEECGIPLSNIAKYVESFQYGAYPHGGAGIGLERVVMLFLGLDNIRKTSMFPRTPTRLEP